MAASRSVPPRDERAPTSVTDDEWIWEYRRENVDRNCCPPEEIGKWMMFYPANVVDDAWSRAQTLYRSGQLPDIRGMKVSTNMPKPTTSNEKVIIFYCGPASDKNRMMAIGRDVAKKMRYHKNFITYKTDQQTHAGISGSTYRINLR